LTGSLRRGGVGRCKRSEKPFEKRPCRAIAHLRQ
jgi:hypothetical protein